MKIIYTTDVHGDIHVYEKLLGIGAGKDIGAVIIGGDVSPGFDMQEQRDFFEFYLIPRIRKFTGETKKPVFMILGNDDFILNEDIIEEADRHRILKYAHNRIVPFRQLFVAGYSIVNPGPIILKEWERQEPEIKKDLEKIMGRYEPSKTIFIFHAPPFNTSLDVHWSGRHVGSTAIREFIEKRQPKLTLHGHIHESFSMTKQFMQKIGKTVSVNPGNANMVLVDLKSMEVRQIRAG